MPFDSHWLASSDASSGFGGKQFGRFAYGFTPAFGREVAPAARLVSQGFGLGWYVSRFQRWVEVGWWSFGCPIAFVAAHSCAKCERMNGALGMIMKR